MEFKVVIGDKDHIVEIPSEYQKQIDVCFFLRMEGNWGYLCSDHFGSEHVDEASTLRGTPFSDKLTLRRTYFLDVK